MKMLKYSLFLLAPLGQLSAAVHTFDGLTSDSALTTAEAGWTLSEANTANAPLAYVGPLVAGSITGGLGGEFADPAVNSTSVKLTMASSLTSSYASVGFDMLIKDSTNEVPARDAFGFSVANGSGATIVQLKFLPVAQSLNPEAGVAAQWQLAYSVGGGATTFTDVAFTESALYFVSLSFAVNGLTLTVGNTVDSDTFNATIPGFDGGVNGIGNLAFNWDKSSPTAAFGDNSILFDNISVAAVPEPSALLMSGVASIALLGRRRRK
jgi:hypothetical protein